MSEARETTADKLRAAGVDGAAIRRINAAGYRILAPGQLDPETIEAAAKVSEAQVGQTNYDLEPEAAVSENVTSKGIASAIRALKGEDCG